MSKFPQHPSFEYVPGRVVRKREVTAIGAFIRWLKNGLRPQRRRIPGAIYGLAAAASIPDVSDPNASRAFTAASQLAHVLLPGLYVGDRICGYGVSIQRATTASPLVELLKIQQNYTPVVGVWTGAITVLHSFLATTTPLARGVQSGHVAPITVERGYMYRIRVTSAANGDELAAGFVDVDHPREN